MQVFKRRFKNEVFCGERAQLETQHLVKKFGGADFKLICGGPQKIVRRIGLRIEIDHQGFFATRCADCGKIAGDGAFANAAFLIENNTFHDVTPVNVELRIVP